MLGKALRGKRDQAVIASKFSPEQRLGRSGRGGLRAKSEALLDTDRIDLYQIHWPSREVPWEETWRALEGLRDAGKIRYLAVSNFGVRDMDRINSRSGHPSAISFPTT
jgi:aryl-alcohol dehydrogenase-like predicted oxidoreductase